jgi:hypothetical protein
MGETTGMQRAGKMQADSLMTEPGGKDEEFRLTFSFPKKVVERESVQVDSRR